MLLEAVRDKVDGFLDGDFFAGLDGPGAGAEAEGKVACRAKPTTAATGFFAVFFTTFFFSSFDGFVFAVFFGVFAFVVLGLLGLFGLACFFVVFKTYLQI